MQNHRAPRQKPPMLIGRKPVLEALESGATVEKVFILRTASGEELNLVKRICRERNIPLSMVPEEKLNGFTGTPHQGIVAITGSLVYTELQDALSHVVESGEIPLFLLLDGITDVRNAGAIGRTALCMGAQGIILPTSNSVALTEEAIKTSAGALRSLLLCRVPSAAQAMDILLLNGIQVLATDMRGSKAVQEADLTLPTCVVMGAEDKGVGKDVLRRAHGSIHVPMPGSFDSLNVSVAAGMILYETARQRNAVGL